MKHTRGPWHVMSNERFISDDTGICIAEAFDRGSEIPSVSDNAHLIAAAPDLLAACKFVIYSLEAQGDGNTDMAILCWAAIKKAKGE